MTAVYVTHDQTEALTMADRVAVMQDGEIVQESPPRDIYQKPKSRFVASFIGQINFLDGKITAPGMVETPAGTLRFEDSDAPAVGTDVTVAIRPENLFPQTGGVASEGNQLVGEVEDVVFLGGVLECAVKTGAASLTMQLHPSNTVQTGASVGYSVRPEDVKILTA